MENLCRHTALRNPDMDFSQIIPGTRQYFQGHPGKSKEDAVDSEPQLIETKCVFKKNEPYSFNSTSYSGVMKLNYPVQSSSQCYPRLYCEQKTYQEKNSSSYQINEACAVDVGSKYSSCAEPNISQITHKHTFQYEEHNWKNNILPKSCDSLPKMPFNQVPTYLTKTNTNRNFTYQQQQQGSVKMNEFIVPARSYFQGYVPEAANLSQYSEIVQRQPFVQSTEIVSRKQSSASTNVCQTQRSPIPCPANTNSRNFPDKNRLLRQTEQSSAVVSRNCVFNQNYLLPNQSNQQQMDHKIPSNSIGNHKDMRSAFPQEPSDIFENGEVTRQLQNPSQQNYHSREPSKTISKKCVFIPFCASAETETLFHSSTNFQPDQPTHLSESPAKIKSDIGSDLCGVSVIQHSMNNPAISVGFIPKNEERMSVISYPRQRGSGNEKSVTNHISDTKCVQFRAFPVNVIQPKKDSFLFGRNSVCLNIPSSSTNLPNEVNTTVVTAEKDVNRPSSQLVQQSPNKATKPKKIIVKSFGNPPDLIPTSNSVLIATTLIKSDPIVSDEKWEEWKSSFDTEWNAFVKDLANSRNIKRIHRISQPIPKKIKRKDHIPHKSSSDLKPSKIEDFTSDEDIPLSLRRKVKEEQ